MVSTTLGSYVPTFAYSSSTCERGSAGKVCQWRVRCGSRLCSSVLTGLSLVQNKVLANRARIVAKLGRQLLALRDEVLDTLLALKDTALLRLVRLFENVLAALTRLSPELGEKVSSAGNRR